MIQPLQEAAEDLPQRLRPERRPSLLSQLQVLPKSVWRTQRQEVSTTTAETAENRALRDGSQNQVAPSGFSDNILYELVRPKKPRKNPSRKRPLHVTDLALRQEEEPRQASDISSAKYHVASELTDAEKKGLDELIHAEEDSVTPTATIFGPLTQVGRLHAQARRQQDPPPKDQTDKQRRRKDRAYIKERLLPNTMERNQDPQTYRSKILHTEGVPADPTSPPTKYLELDLGWCIIERRHAGNGQSEVIAFSGAEVTLSEPQD